MSNQTAKWSDFWRTEGVAFFDIMKLSTAVFARKFDNHFAINSNHRILDFGCGPGFFMDYVVAKGAKAVGADINSLFTEECKRRIPAATVFQLPADHTMLGDTLDKALRNEKFDFIVLLSISQYFDGKDELQRIVNVLLDCLAERGQIIIADVVEKETSSIRDLMAVFMHCLGKGSVFRLIRFVNYLLFSKYRDTSRNVSLQSYSEQDMQSIASSSNLVCTRIDGLTLHPTRSNYALARSRSI